MSERERPLLSFVLHEMRAPLSLKGSLLTRGTYLQLDIGTLLSGKAGSGVQFLCPHFYFVGYPEAGDHPMTSSKKGRHGGNSSSLQTDPDKPDNLADLPGGTDSQTG